jgi:MFS family permease
LGDTFVLMWGLVYPLDLIMTSRWIIAFTGTLVLLLTQGFGRRYGFLLAHLTIALSFLLLAFWRSTPGFCLSSIVFGISLSAIPAIMAAAVGNSMGGKLAPAALGFITLIFGIGQSLGPAVAGWIRDTTGTFAGAFILSAGISLLGAARSMIFRKKA